MTSFAGTIWLLSRQSRPMVATLSFAFAAILALLLLESYASITGWMVIIGGDTKRNAKRGKCATVLHHISPPFFTAADEAWRRNSSLSPTTPQLVTGCSLTLRQKSAPTALEGRM
ncbi:hypothetical protein BLNAU_7493 [Blattamonas nauphoetae]|uniref:Secreted protein n=1 Tax=Blattamonas nauphoetae TaxID=2049346 RepID=A0ABQ9Y1N9_9EUKA|nr:hypothetical protein BLNAU_7493 [Blattamonas nauphoetae]